MSIERALEILGDLLYYSYSASKSDTGDAIKLAIKVLRAAQDDQLEFEV